MKNIILLAAMLLLTVSAQASVYGKFKLKVDPGYYDAEEVVFLMNSQGDTLILENKSYYELEALPFFGEITLNFRSGGDEDFVLGSFHLVSNNKKVASTASCATLVDGPNGLLHELGKKAVKLYRWNKAKKKYDLVSWGSQEASEKCYEQFTDRYPDYDTY